MVGVYQVSKASETMRSHMCSHLLKFGAICLAGVTALAVTEMLTIYATITAGRNAPWPPLTIPTSAVVDMQVADAVMDMQVVNPDASPILECKQGGFRVSMPGAAQEITTIRKTPAGDVPLTMFVYDTPNGSFVVTFMDFSERQNKEQDAQFVENVLDGARNGAVATVGGALVNECGIELGHYRGREMLIATTVEDTSVFLRQRCYLVHSRMYCINVAGTNEMVHDKTSQEFLDSFELLESTSTETPCTGMVQ